MPPTVSAPSRLRNNFARTYLAGLVARHCLRSCSTSANTVRPLERLLRFGLLVVGSAAGSLGCRGKAVSKG